MRLILFRHGIAEARQPGLDDTARRLTKEGIARTALASRGLATLIGPVDRVLTSTKARAMQTAELLCGVLDISAEVCEPLAGGGVEDLIGLLANRKEEVLVMVGHEPTLSMLAEAVCTGQSPGFIDLKKAGAIVLRVDVSGGRSSAMLEAVYPPKTLRDVAQA